MYYKLLRHFTHHVIIPHLLFFQDYLKVLGLLLLFLVFAYFFLFPKSNNIVIFCHYIIQLINIRIVILLFSFVLFYKHLQD